MANRKKEVYKPMTEGKRNLIQGLLQEYDIQCAEDIQDALKDLLSRTIQDMLETEMDNHLGYDRYERSGEPNYGNGTKPKTVRSKYYRPGGRTGSTVPFQICIQPGVSCLPQNTGCMELKRQITVFAGAAPLPEECPAGPVKTCAAAKFREQVPVVLFNKGKPGVFGVNTDQFPADANCDDFRVGKLSIQYIASFTDCIRSILGIQVINNNINRYNKVFKSCYYSGMIINDS